MTTFFAVRDEIAEKLKEIPEFLKIYTPANSTTVTELSQVTPSAHVNFARITIKDVAARGKAVILGQQWAVAIACRNAASQQSHGDALNDELGLLTDKVINLLSGWQPPSSKQPLVLLDCRDAYSTGFAYNTLIFESQRINGSRT